MHSMLIVAAALCVAKCTAEQHVIMLSAPNAGEPYYADRYYDILNYQATFVKSVQAPDKAYIVADTEGRQYLLKLGLSKSDVLPIDVYDIWMRDFGPVRPSRLAKFQYRPNYLEKSVARQIQQSLFRGFQREDVSLALDESRIILDGGNVVDNHVDTAIMTTRVLDDNSRMGEDRVIQQLKEVMGYSRIIIVDELPDDTTGHSDGMLSFIDEDVLAVVDVGEPYLAPLLSQLRSELDPAVKVLTLPTHYDVSWFKGDFPTACGLHVNLIATDENLYVPTFGHDAGNRQVGHTKEMDEKVLKMIRENTSKNVVPIPVPNRVCIMGGSVRCLSFQVSGITADHIVELAGEMADV